MYLYLSRLYPDHFTLMLSVSAKMHETLHSEPQRKISNYCSLSEIIYTKFIKNDTLQLPKSHCQLFDQVPKPL